MQLYDQLLVIAPGPVASCTVPSPSPRSPARRPRLRELAGLPLDDYYLFHAVRADLLRRSGQPAAAADAYRAALELCGNATEREFLRGRLEAVAGS